MANHLKQHVAPGIDGDEHREGVGGIFRSLRILMSRTRWMLPVDTCKLVSGADFGRNIQRELNALGEKDGPGVLAVSIRRQMKAVVVTPEHYEEMRQMREKFEALVAAQAKTDVEDARDHFEALYARITSDQSRAAAEALFCVNGDDLANSYRPGATETDQ